MAQPGDDFLQTYTANWHNKVERHVDVTISEQNDTEQEPSVLDLNGKPHEALEKYQPVGISDPYNSDYAKDPDPSHQFINLNTKALDNNEPDNWGVVQAPSPGDGTVKVKTTGLTWIKTDYDPGNGNFLRVEGGQIKAGVLGKAFVIRKEDIGSGNFMTLAVLGTPNGGVLLGTYTLTADMSGGTATADINILGGDTENGVTLTDLVGNAQGQETNDTGLAIKAGDDEWYVIEVLTTAASATTDTVSFTLTADLAATPGSTANGTVDVSNAAGIINGALLTFTNPVGFRAYTGATGWAIKTNSVWWIVVVNEQCALAEVTFSTRSHSESGPSGSNTIASYGAVANKNTVAISGSIDPISSYPHNHVKASPEIENPYNLRWNVNDKGIISWDREIDKYIVIEVKTAVARSILFRLDADWPNGLNQSSNNVTALLALNGEAGDLPSSFTVYDRYNVACNAKQSGLVEADHGEALWNDSTEEYDIIKITHIATKVLGTVAADASGTPATFTVNGTSGLDGRLPSNPITVQNRYNWCEVSNGDPIELVRNPANGDWYPTSPSTLQYITDVMIDTATREIKVSKDCGATYTVVHTGTACS